MIVAHQQVSLSLFQDLLNPLHIVVLTYYFFQESKNLINLMSLIFAIRLYVNHVKIKIKLKNWLNFVYKSIQTCSSSKSLTFSFSNSVFSFFRWLFACCISIVMTLLRLFAFSYFAFCLEKCFFKSLSVLW